MKLLKKKWLQSKYVERNSVFLWKELMWSSLISLCPECHMLDAVYTQWFVKGTNIVYCWRWLPVWGLSSDAEDCWTRGIILNLTQMLSGCTIFWIRCACWLIIIRERQPDYINKELKPWRSLIILYLTPKVQLNLHTVICLTRMMILTNKF